MEQKRGTDAGVPPDRQNAGNEFGPTVPIKARREICGLF